MEPEFFEQSPKKQVSYLHRLASSLNHALDLMQKERDKYAGEVLVLKQSVDNAQKALDIQKTITRSMIEGANADGQEAAERIHELEAQIKDQDELTYGYKH
jgi:predicted  nucleic acid-binding Zn-ribbon protein